MKLAILGTRGVPACYGGFETFAQELGLRLVDKGHEVRVYGRKHVIDYPEKDFKGIEIVLLPAPKQKYLETPVHSLICLIHLLFHPVDVVIVCNAANSPFLWLALLRGIPVILNVDGIERKRAKWSAIGRLWYFLGEFCSRFFATQVISDAFVIRDYYKKVHALDTTVIPYGFAPVREEEVVSKLEGVAIRPKSREIFEELGVSPGEYILYVSRLEPENNAHRVVQAYNGLDPALKEIPLVIVGDAPYAKEYIASLKSMAGDAVIFAGFRFGDSYYDLQLGAKVYIQATEVGGTHPALVEAMGFGNCIIANGTPENVEVVAESGLIYRTNDVDDLRDKLLAVLEDSNLLCELRSKARKRAEQKYEWGEIVSKYEELCGRLAKC